jgi:hypothetical protein
MNRLRLISIVCILGMLVNGCGIILPLTKNTSKLSKLKISMTTEEVKEAIGEPDEVRGSRGQTVVWQYDLYKSSDALTNLALGILTLSLLWWFPREGQWQPYWLYFNNDVLSQWGYPGDWGNSPDKTYEIRRR